MNRKNSLKHVLAFLLAVMMMLPMFSPVSVYAAEGLYLAYQNTETGKPVVEVKSASAKVVYKVTELNMSKGDSVNLCFINASFWKDAEWTSDNEKVVTVDREGIVTAVGEGVTKVTLTYKKKVTNRKVSASAMIYVGEDNWKVHIGTTADDIPESRELKAGRKVDLAFFGVSDWNGGKLFQVTWTSSDEKIVSVNKSNGMITALRPGTAKIKLQLFNKVSKIAFNDTIEVEVLPLAFSDSTWQNGNYLTYGENYFRLFSGDYMFRIPGSVLDKHVLKEYGKIAETPAGGAVTESYYNGITNLSGLDRFLMGAFEFLQNGTSITVGAVTGGKETYEEGKSYACILSFVEELHKNENSISAIVSSATETTDILNLLYTEGVDLSKTELLDALGESEYLTETEIEEMVDELYANYDLIGGLVSEGVTITEYISSVMKLHEVDEAVLYSLSQCTEDGRSLDKALDVLYRERDKNGAAACAEKYLSGKAADVINGVISKGTAGASDAVMKVAGKVEEVLHLDMDSYYAAVEFGSYQAELRFYCRALLEEINANYDSYTEEELKNKIEAYEFAYEAYITATRMMLEEALKIVKSSEKSRIQSGLNLLNNFDYNYAVDLAMKYFKMDNPDADEQEKAKANEDETVKQPAVENSKTQYRYHHYTDGNGDYAVCGYYGVNIRGWKNVYRQEIQVDEPLTEAASGYRHPHQSGCDEIGCWDTDYWTNGGKYVDEHGTVWYRQEEIIVDKNANETQSYSVIREGIGTSMPTETPQPSAPTVTPEPIVTPEPTPTQTVTGRMTIQEKLDYFLEKIEKIAQPDGRVYFTVNQKECGVDIPRHRCKNCKISKVIKEDWFGELFDGKINDVKLLPKHTLESDEGIGDAYDGYSCFGFACFLQWYLYSDTIKEEQTGIRTETIKFNYENARQYVKPGDSIRVNSHSFIVYEVKDKGIEVVDCNYYIVKGNCAVERHMIEYTDKKYGGKTAYIDRVEKAATMDEGMAGLFDVPVDFKSSGTTNTDNNTKPTATPTPAPESKVYGVLVLSSPGNTYNVGTDVEMGSDYKADKTYTLKNGATVEILSLQTNSKGRKIYHVYAPDLGMECYIGASYIKLK